MGISEAITLGVIQGLTEFLPVSSSGHLVVMRTFFNIPDVGGNAFDAFLHLGTLLAVLVFYWPVWWGIVRGIVKNDEEGKDKRELAAKLALATIPAAIIGYFFQHEAATIFRSRTSVAVGLLITASAFLIVDLFARQRTTIKRASFLDAIIIGTAQIMALIPGVSRSGITIASGIGRGLPRKQAVTFSFLLSAPIIAGAGLASLGTILSHQTFNLSIMLAGLIASFLAGFIGIYLLVKLVERMYFWPFIVYLVGLSLILLL